MYKINVYQADVTNNVNNERRIYLGTTSEKEKIRGIPTQLNYQNRYMN